MNQIETVLSVLNSAFAADPGAIQALCENRVPCNRLLAEHPSIQVCVDRYEALVGALGLLNGVLEALGVPLVASQWDGQRMVGFCAYIKRGDS
jgi:hypothetical protein